MASFEGMHKSSVSGISSFREDTQLTDEEQILKIEYSRYIRNKILYECISDCVDDLDPQTGKNLENIINGVKLQQYLKLENHSLLGLHPEFTDLSYQESDQLKAMTQKKLCERKSKTFEVFKSITSKDLDVIIKRPKVSLYDLSLSVTDQVALNYKEKLIRIQEAFMKNIILRNKILAEMLDLRLNKVPELCEKTNRYCKSIIECNYLKAKIAEYKMKMDIFMEVPNAIDAYHQLLNDIKKQHEECQIDIEKMKESKRKYENVSGKEYDEILKSYLMYKYSLAELNKMCDLVK